MSSGIYSIGLSGLQASSARINTTGQNTTNVDTEGYSRQKTSTTSSPVGGVRIRETERVVDQFVNQQVRSDTSNHAYYDKYHSLMSSADSLLGEESVSLNGYLDDAFKALQAANNDPTSSSLRSLSYSSMQTLVNQYKTVSGLVGEQKKLAGEQLKHSISDLNNLTDQVSHLNGKILQQETLSISPANELRDQQEKLARDIAKYLNIKTKFQDNGVMTIQLANGQPLVMDQKSTLLKTKTDPLDPENTQLFIDFGSYDVGVSTEKLGGSIGGLFDYQTEFAERANRLLGQNAISITDKMNKQNALGLNNDGNLGKALFSTGDIRVYGGPGNTGDAPDIAVRVTPGASSEISTDTYELIKTDDSRFLVQTYDVNGKLTGKTAVLDVNATQPDKDGFYTVDGLGVDVRLGDVSRYDLEDVFHFTPSQGAASALHLVANSGDDIALSAPIGVSSGENNLSEASISLSSVTSTDPESSAFASDGSLYPSAPQSIYFTAKDAYEVRDGRGNVLAAVKDVHDYRNLLEQAGLAKEAGFDVSVSSEPREGDVFSMGTELLGPSDNFNGLQLADLQNQNLVGGRTTLTEAYSDLVSSVGSKTNALETNEKASEAVMNESLARRDEISGVSLDEEAVNLLKYQQSYSASAQVINAARTTFDTLLGAVG